MYLDNIVLKELLDQLLEELKPDITRIFESSSYNYYFYEGRLTCHECTPYIDRWICPDQVQPKPIICYCGKLLRYWLSKSAIENELSFFERGYIDIPEYDKRFRICCLTKAITNYLGSITLWSNDLEGFAIRLVKLHFHNLPVDLLV